ncbi:DNA translocase FtsK [Pelagibacterium montanilacus]|uniref:DNA translocase FtsK n=1 Tax=Pelagibacterium montanilacus TaxID=2185280 RepID=UPI000F8F0B07|nr:DNA translocase FtsK [Pelagibacterium montanilacus]
MSLNPAHFDQTRTGGPVLAITIPLRAVGLVVLALFAIMLASLASWSVDDPSLSYATDKPVENWLGFPGAVMADIAFQVMGLGALVMSAPPLVWAYAMIRRRVPSRPVLRLVCWLVSALFACGIFALLPVPESWPLPLGLGGFVGAGFQGLYTTLMGSPAQGWTALAYGAALALPTALCLVVSARPERPAPTARKTPSKARKAPAPERDESEDTDTDDRDGMATVIAGYFAHLGYSVLAAGRRLAGLRAARRKQQEWTPPRSEPQLDRASPYAASGPTEPWLDGPVEPDREAEDDYFDYDEDDGADIAPRDEPVARQRTSPRVVAPSPRPAPSSRPQREAQTSFLPAGDFELPPLDLLAAPSGNQVSPEHHPDALEANAKRLEGVLEDFGVKGDIINVRPGPVVTLYELEPAPGIKSSRVISLADDIARSMSAIAARVAVVPGRNAIGIELPNKTRETVFLRELLDCSDYDKAKAKLPICLGKTIGGEPIIVDLARMPHLLIAGTTGSGKSVGINTMILSLLYKMSPEQCRLIMIDPKMLELSVYDGIPHLLTPVVTDPAKAVVALKWAVREMEDRYKKMSKIGVRNIDGFNQRVAEAAGKGEVITRTVQTGFDRETGEAIFESEEFDLEPLPYIVVIVDEMADLMMVAGKDIEGTIQRLAQMARAAGIHIIMATQRPSVDVITGTIKANFPTRVSFQVTSKIDSRTILGEQGAEQLLGNGDMLYMAGGGRIKRLHGAFVADGEVEDIVAHLKSQGSPEYLESITSEEEDQGGGFSDDGAYGGSGDELYDKAVNIVLTDKKASTSYIQRRLSVGYNKAATLIERMEQEGIISPANHAGKREVLVGDNADGY